MSSQLLGKGEAGMEDLIPVVNKLQDIVFSSSSCGNLDLPQVVVVGAQSSGKSSVIELLVRRDFLPRGTGIVTRRPLAISLINDDSEYCEFLHVKNRKYTDFEEVRKEIENETLRIAGSNKGISSVPISLKIHSPHVLDLTVVDLPGVTKVPIGDQPADIEKQTKELVLGYIENPNSIILAVTPANQDIVNSESLKMARSVDPQGHRTLGVLTKLDLMDKGTNALDVLNGNTYPLSLGFIGIVNRSQQDIQDKKSLDESLDAEKDFFRSHPAYRSIAHKCGTTYLSKSINQILMTHIRDRLPDIKARINTLIGQTEQELSNFGQTQIPESTDQQGALILTMMMRYSQSFVGNIEGRSNDIDMNGVKELGGGARIYQIFSDIFAKNLEKIDPLDHLSYSDIRVAILNSAGPRASLFVPELAFDILMKPLVKLLEAPSQQCVEMVYEELMKICHTCGSIEFDRFPKLQSELIDTLSKLLNEKLGPTSKYVSSLIDIQRAYIKTDHAKFISASDAMNSVLEDKQQREFNTLQKTRAAERAERAKREESHHPNGDSEASTAEKKEKKEKKSHSSSSSISATASAGDDNGDTPLQKDIFLRYFLGKGAGLPRQDIPYFSANGGGSAEKTSLPLSGSTVQKDVDEDLSKEARAMKNLRLERMETEAAALADDERLQCDLMFKLIESYFSIVRETISDQVPKAIMHFLVNETKSSAQNRLVSSLYKASLFNELLFEDESVVLERKKLLESLATYRSAAKVITEVI